MVSVSKARSRSQSPRKAKLQTKLAHMALQLAPLVKYPTGEVHPVFPSTLLNYWVLTSDQCDELAHFYHQRTPCLWTKHYPRPIKWQRDAPLEEKRRRIGQFIGLSWCESPTRSQSEDEIMQEVRNARALEDENEALRRKTRW